MDWAVRFGPVGDLADSRTAVETVLGGIETTVERVGECRGGGPHSSG
ncbi:hypothetical protein [Natronobacterium gregoryi]|uniref:Uncharacterized protein n=1 Tax=Natronobacterium gregoryi TaxID=44930 RepID=A0A1I3P727_9EURY|nr:hypothetical protein [Natronobacterium gregoryi]SFJ17364.1 hypothetical protein SAMN05443661_11652 [Natronobacterium gregoryi]